MIFGMRSSAPASAGLFNVGTTAGPFGFKTAGRVSRDIGRAGATVGAARLETAGTYPDTAVVFAGVVGLGTAGGSLGNISCSGVTVVVTGLKMFGKSLGKVVPA